MVLEISNQLRWKAGDQSFLKAAKRNDQLRDRTADLLLNKPAIRQML
jgi:hypothetical protein